MTNRLSVWDGISICFLFFLVSNCSQLLHFNCASFLSYFPFCGAEIVASFIKRGAVDEPILNEKGPEKKIKDYHRGTCKNGKYIKKEKNHYIETHL